MAIPYRIRDKKKQISLDDLNDDVLFIILSYLRETRSCKSRDTSIRPALGFWGVDFGHGKLVSSIQCISLVNKRLRDASISFVFRTINVMCGWEETLDYFSALERNPTVFQYIK